MKRGIWSSTETSALSVSPRVGSRRNKLLENGLRLGGYPRKTGGNVGLGRLRRFGMDIITWVNDWMAVGGGIWSAANMEKVSLAGITHIINMQKEFPDDAELAQPYPIEVLWNPIDDDFQPKPPEIFELGVGFAEEALKDPKAKLFIHCAAGVHRAPMMALALLAVRERMSVEDAMDLIQEKRPVADFADVYVQSVERFLRGRS
jgi:protein-tyrosine phosphatase